MITMPGWFCCLLATFHFLMGAMLFWVTLVLDRSLCQRGRCPMTLLERLKAMFGARFQGSAQPASRGLHTFGGDLVLDPAEVACVAIVDSTDGSFSEIEPDKIARIWRRDGQSKIITSEKAGRALIAYLSSATVAEAVSQTPATAATGIEATK